jgi:hypothetical protein
MPVAGGATVAGVRADWQPARAVSATQPHAAKHGTW